MKNEIVIAIILSIIAISGCIGLGGYVYYNQPETADISGINSNTISIDLLKEDIRGIKADIKIIVEDLISPGVDEDDLDEIEDKVNDIKRDIKKIESCAERDYDDPDESYKDFEDCMINKFN